MKIYYLLQPAKKYYSLQVCSRSKNSLSYFVAYFWHIILLCGTDNTVQTIFLQQTDTNRERIAKNISTAPLKPFNAVTIQMDNYNKVIAHCNFNFNFCSSY